VPTSSHVEVDAAFQCGEASLDQARRFGLS
jgi:hypothetical protein